MTFMNMLYTRLVSASFLKEFLTTESKESNILKWERQLHTRSTGAVGRHSNAVEHMCKSTNCTPAHCWATKPPVRILPPEPGERMQWEG